jgi:hypothetical protein
MKKIITLIFLFLISCNGAFSQSLNDTVSKKEINCPKLSLIGGITAVAFIYGYAVQNNLWWKGDKSEFHFVWKQDWVYALGEDKYGHFFFPYLVSNIYSQALEWAGFDEEKSLWYSSSFALAYETFVEVRDGFSKQWGFSWGDFSADALGSAYPILQHKIPFLKNFNFKISFNPSDRFKHGSNRVIFDDYESTYDWLSINVHNLLPKNIRRFYPAFINLTVGHSVEKLDNLGGGNHRFYIGLDWNLEALPGSGWFWKLLKRNLNYYHFPSPVIQIFPHVIWFGLKF